MTPQKERLWTKAFIAVCIIGMVIRLCNPLQNAVLPLYIQDLGYSKSAAGLMTTFYAFAALFMRPFIGNILDRKGRKPVLIVGTVIFAVGAVTIGFVQALPLLFALRILSGIGFSANSVAISTMSTDVVPESRMTEGIGYFGLITTVTMAFGPMIGLGLLDRFGYMSTFLVVAVFSLVGIALAVLMKFNNPREKDAPPVKAKESEPQETLKWWEKIIERNSMYPSLLIMFCAFAISSTNTFIALFAQERAIENIGVFFTLSAVGMAISRLFIGQLTKSRKSRMLTFSSALLAVSFAIIPFSYSIAPLLLVSMLYGFSYGILQTILNSMAIISTPFHRRGAANATFYMAMDIGIGGGSALWGVLADAFGVGNIYFGAALFIVASIILQMILSKKRLLH